MKRWWQRLGQTFAQNLVDAQAAQAAGPGLPCPQRGRETPLKGVKAKEIETCVGGINTCRHYYHCPHCVQGIFPLDKQLGIQEQPWSEAVAQQAVWLYGHGEDGANSAEEWWRGDFGYYHWPKRRMPK